MVFITKWHRQSPGGGVLPPDQGGMARRYHPAIPTGNTPWSYLPAIPTAHIPGQTTRPYPPAIPPGHTHRPYHPAIPPDQPRVASTRIHAAPRTHPRVSLWAGNGKHPDDLRLVPRGTLCLSARCGKMRGGLQDVGLGGLIDSYGYAQ